MTWDYRGNNEFNKGVHVVNKVVVNILKKERRLYFVRWYVYFVDDDTANLVENARYHFIYQYVKSRNHEKSTSLRVNRLFDKKSRVRRLKNEEKIYWRGEVQKKEKRKKRKSSPIYRTSTKTKSDANNKGKKNEAKYKTER